MGSYCKALDISKGISRCWLTHGYMSRILVVYGKGQ